MAIGAEQTALPTELVVPELSIYRLSVAQYHRMIETGILTDEDPLELLEGWLVGTTTKYPPHSLAKGLTAEALTGLIPEGWFVMTEDPLTTLDSEPELDVMVVRGHRRDYRDRHPGPQDVILVVEVADASLTRDQTTKKRIYARAGVPVYWIINLIAQRIEVYTDPTGPIERPDYRTRQEFGAEETLPVRIEGLEVGRIAVRDLLP